MFIFVEVLFGMMAVLICGEYREFVSRELKNTQDKIQQLSG